MGWDKEKKRGMKPGLLSTQYCHNCASWHGIGQRAIPFFEKFFGAKDCDGCTLYTLPLEFSQCCEAVISSHIPYVAHRKLRDLSKIT